MQLYLAVNQEGIFCYGKITGEILCSENYFVLDFCFRFKLMDKIMIKSNKTIFVHGLSFKLLVCFATKSDGKGLLLTKYSNLDFWYLLSVSLFFTFLSNIRKSFFCFSDKILSEIGSNSNIRRIFL